MATGKRYYWIKLKDSFMNSEVVDFLMSQPNGANYVVLYQMLCLKTINTGGRLTCQIGDVIIPFDILKDGFRADMERIKRELTALQGVSMRIILLSLRPSASRWAVKPPKPMLKKSSAG